MYQMATTLEIPNNQYGNTTDFAPYHNILRKGNFEGSWRQIRSLINGRRGKCNLSLQDKLDDGGAPYVYEGFKSLKVQGTSNALSPLCFLSRPLAPKCSERRNLNPTSPGK